MPNFLPPNQNKLNLWRPELRYGEQDYGTRVVGLRQQQWLFKHSPDIGVKKRELLAYLLGKGLVNIAEVKLLTFEEITEIKVLGLIIPDEATPENTVLIRLAQDYSMDELPLKTLEEATAGELVFSTWIRRRDAHENNRAYTIEKIPVFYDHHASLNFEPDLVDINRFFGNVGAGHAGTWRVKEIGDNSIDIVTMRSGQWGGNHFIRDRNKFKQDVQIMVDRILSDSRNYKDLVMQAGFDGEDIEKISSFLMNNKAILPQDVEEMFKIIFKED